VTQVFRFNEWFKARPSHWIPIVGMLLFSCFAVAQSAAGAEAAVDGPSETVPAESEGSPSVMSMIVDSGPMGWAFMLVLGAFSVYATMVAVERYAATKRNRLIPPLFIEQLQDIAVGRTATLTELRDLCAKSDGPPANILSAGLLRFGRPLPEVEKAMEDAAAREMGELRSRVRPLSVMGSVAPLVGLQGTVVGMIQAFYTASAGGLGGRGESLAQGIYLALLTTAAGLAIAIPCVMLASFYNGKIESAFREIDLHLSETLPSFSAAERPSETFHGEEREAASSRLLAAAK
jgi:biopolymer transport protein ExbB